MQDSTTLEAYEEPSSFDEAEDARKRITADIQNIQAQMGDKQRTDKEGFRLSRQDYWSWKKRAQFQLNAKLAILRSLKIWIKENRPHQTVDEQALKHLRELLDVLADIELEAEELDLYNSACSFVKRVG